MFLGRPLLPPCFRPVLILLDVAHSDGTDVSVVVRVNENRDREAGDSSRFLGGAADAVRGGAVAVSAPVLQQVPDVDDDCPRDGRGRHPLAFQVLNLEPTELVLKTMVNIFQGYLSFLYSLSK